MPLPRLPDISLDTWIRDQQQQFERQISSLGEATEFSDAVSDIESQVPADYPHPGGTDQWAEAQRQQQEEEYRRQQDEDERRQAEENQRQLDAYLNEKMRYEQEQQAQAQQDALLQQTQQAGIASPDQALAEFEAVKPGDIPQPVQDFHDFASQIEQGRLPAGMEEMAARPQSPSLPRGVPSAYDVAPQIGQQAPPPIEEPAPRRGVPSAYDVAPQQEPPPIPQGERPYWTPTAREQEGMGAPKGPEWLPESVRQIGGVVTKAGAAALRAEPKESITLPTGREVGIPGWAQQAVGSLAAGSEPINAAQDYASARIDPQTWYFARDGIARTELEPGELDRWNELQGSIASSGFAGPTKSTWTPEEAAEIQRTTDKIDRIYQSIKHDPDKLTDYAEASPAYRATQMVTGVVLGGALGNVASGAASGGARALGASERVARGAGYAADIAAQTAFDPTTPAIQPLGDIALRGVGAGVRGGRSLLGRAGRALEASADEIPTGTERLGSGFQTAMDMEADPAFEGMRPRAVPSYGPATEGIEREIGELTDRIAERRTRIGNPDTWGVDYAARDVAMMEQQLARRREVLAATQGRVNPDFPGVEPRVIVPEEAGEGITSSADWNSTDRAWKQPNGATVRGVPLRPDDSKIPDTVYHATTNLPAVQADGLLRAGGVGGLGGDARDNMVSLTTSRAVAEQLAEDIRLSAQLARIREPLKETTFTTHDGRVLPTTDWISPEAQRAYQDEVLAFLQTRARDEGWTWQPHLSESFRGKDALREYFSGRSYQTTKPNPIMVSDMDVFARVDPEKIGVVEVPRASLRTGSLLTDFDLGRGHLEEIRSYGDVPLRPPTTLGSGVSPRLRAPLFNAAQGGFFGAASENLEAQQEGREVDPATQLHRTLIGGGLGLLAGSRGARRLGGRALQRLGSGVVPEGGRAVDSTAMIQGIRQIRAAGAADDAVLNAERHVAEQTNMTLDEVQQLTRADEAVNPWEPTAAERAEVARQDAEIAGRPAHGGYLAEDDAAERFWETADNPTVQRRRMGEDIDDLVANPDQTVQVSNTAGDSAAADKRAATVQVAQERGVDVHWVRDTEQEAIEGARTKGTPWEYWQLRLGPEPARRVSVPRETTMLEPPPRAGEEVASEVAAAENIIPEDLEQRYLPGMRPRTRRPSPAQRAEATVDEMREGVREQYQAERTPFKLDDIWARAAAMRRTTPEKLRAVFEQAQTQRGDEAAVAGTAMRQEAAALGEQTRLATEDTLRAKKALDDELLNRDIDPTNLADRQKALKGEDPVLNGLADELEASMQAEAASIADFEAWQKGDFSRRSSAALELRSTQNKVSARQAYRQLKANRSFFAEMESTAAEILAKGETMTEADWTKLRSIQEKTRKKSGSGELLDEVTGRRVRDIEREGIAGVRKARGATDKPLAAVAEETLAERYGRLARRFDELNAEGDTDAAQAIRSMLDDTVDEIKLAADERAMGILNRELKPGLSPEEGMKAIQKAVGDKVVQRENRAALDAADVREGPGGVNLSMKQWRDLQKLQTAFQNRIDKAFKAEGNEQVRIALRKQMSDARYMMGRALDDPDFAPAVQEFRDRVQALRQTAGSGNTTGAKLAKILEDAFHDQSAERAFTGAARDEIGLLQSRIRGIQQQLDEAIKNKDAPGAQARVNELLQDMQDVGGVGKTAADKQRERLMRQNLQDIPVEDQSKLREAIATVDLDDPQSLRMVLDAMRNPTKWDTFRERLYQARLSNPWTWLTNLSSNVATAAGHLGLQNPLERAFGGEAAGGSVAAAKELWRARGEGGQRAWDVFKSGRSQQNMEQLASGDMTGMRREFTTEQGGMKGRMGALMHVFSTRPLEAMDQAVGHMVYQSEVGKLAQREADRLLKVDDVRVKGMTPEEARQSIMQDIWDHPEVMEKARAVRDRVLLRERGSQKWESILRTMAATRDPGLKPGTIDFARAAVMDFVLPFFNVPLNYARQGIQRAGGAPFYAVSGAKKLRAGDRVGAAEDFAKGSIGAAAMATAASLYYGDSLTGPGPEDSGDRAIWLQTHQPYSVKDPLGNWHSYQGTPVAIPFAIVAGAGEGWAKPGSTPIIGGEPMSKAAGALFGAGGGAVRGIASQSFLQGLSQSVELVTNPDFSVGNAAQLGANMALTYGGAAGLSMGVPTLTGMAGFLASMTDRMERDAGRPSGKDAGEFFQNVGARAAARIPGARWNLDPRIGAYGEPVVNQRSWEASGPMALDPYWRGPAPRPGDQISQDLGALGVGRPPAPEAITIKGVSVPLTIHEQRAFDQSYGQVYRELLDSVEASRQEEEARGEPRSTFTADFYVKLRDRARKIAVADVLDIIPPDEFDRRFDAGVERKYAQPAR